ncbi:hypothetical protein SUGI_0957540 [Cryptomeria japonica]|nr:hypothetical protein SUGI_0957540 [Cryptomeria japonica]
MLWSRRIVSHHRLLKRQPHTTKGDPDRGHARPGTNNPKAQNAPEKSAEKPNLPPPSFKPPQKSAALSQTLENPPTTTSRSQNARKEAEKRSQNAPETSRKRGHPSHYPCALDRPSKQPPAQKNQSTKRG